MKAWRDLGKLPSALWSLSLATLTNRLGSMVMPFLALYITKGLGYSSARGGIGLAVWGASALCVGPWMGRLSDRVGAARMMKLSLLFSGLAVLLMPLARSWPVLLSLIVASSVTAEAFRPASLSLIAGLAPDGMIKQSFALNRLAINLGMSVGPAVGGLLAERSFNWLFLADGATTLAAAAILTLSPIRDSNRDVPKTGAPHMRLAPLADPLLRAFLLGILPVLAVFWQHEGAMAVYVVRDLHFSAATYGAFFTLNTLLIVALEIPLNAATSHWPHGRTLALGSLLFGIGFGLLSWARTPFTVAATVAIWTFGEMTLFPAMSAYVSEIAPEARRGEYMGYYLMAFNATLAAGPWIGLVLLDRAGPLLLWPATFVTALISSAALGRLRGATEPKALSYSG